MIDPCVGSALILQGPSQNLSDNSTDLAGSSADTVGSRSVTSWEDLTRYNECGGVGSEILEKVAKAVKREESPCGDDMVSEPDNAEKDGENNETHELDGFAANSVNCCDGDPVTGNQTGARENKIADTQVVKPADQQRKIIL
jgi:hypothetical protein